MNNADGCFQSPALKAAVSVQRLMGFADGSQSNAHIAIASLSHVRLKQETPYLPALVLLLTLHAMERKMECRGRSQPAFQRGKLLTGCRSAAVEGGRLRGRARNGGKGAGVYHLPTVLLQ